MRNPSPFPAKSFACNPSGNSPTSSKNSVKPSACSTNPTLSCIAPANAPRTGPKSSLSNNVSTIAAQLQVNKSARGSAESVHCPGYRFLTCPDFACDQERLKMRGNAACLHKHSGNILGICKALDHRAKGLNFPVDSRDHLGTAGSIDVLTFKGHSSLVKNCTIRIVARFASPVLVQREMESGRSPLVKDSASVGGTTDALLRVRLSSWQVQGSRMRSRFSMCTT